MVMPEGIETLHGETQRIMQADRDAQGSGDGGGGGALRDYFVEIL